MMGFSFLFCSGLGGYISILENCLRNWGLTEVVDTGNSRLWKTELMIFLWSV